MIGPAERRKDTIQVAVESAFSHVGHIATIIAGAGREVTRELGDWATDMFEMREAARRARADELERRGPDAEAVTPRERPSADSTHELRRPVRRR